MSRGCRDSVNRDWSSDLGHLCHFGGYAFIVVAPHLKLIAFKLGSNINTDVNHLLFLCESFKLDPDGNRHASVSVNSNSENAKVRLNLFKLFHANLRKRVY